MIIQSAAVLEAVKARSGNLGVRFGGGATADLDSLCVRQPREICGRDGRKPCGAVKQKKEPKQRKGLTRSHSYKVFGRRHDEIVPHADVCRCYEADEGPPNCSLSLPRPDFAIEGGTKWTGRALGAPRDGRALRFRNPLCTARWN